MHDKSLAIIALAFSGAIGLSGAAHAADFDDNARVISVTPQVEQFNHPRQECQTSYIQEQRPSRGVGGSILGGLAGGLLGNQVGGGNGRMSLRRPGRSLARLSAIGSKTVTAAQSNGRCSNVTGSITGSRATTAMR